MKAIRILLPMVFGLSLATSAVAETISAKIVSGSTVASAPSWMAALWVDKGAETDFCGGTLIDSQWIMTAAHCVIEADSDSVITTMIGQADISAYPDNIATVDEIYIYPYFNTSSFYGDIALLHLTTAQSNTPVTLPYSNASSYLSTGISMRVYGWGETSAAVTQNDSLSVNLLQTAALTYQGFDSDHPGFIFAGDDQSDTCFGDSGGPLIYGGIQYGITSIGFASTCATGIAGGYTDVSRYSSWIDSTIGWADYSGDDSDSSGGGGDTEMILLGSALLLLRLTSRFKL